ncbi:MAG: peroxiredoxin, partial [Pseudomonadota bacterium]
MPSVGRQVRDFTQEATGGEPVNLKSLRGSNVVLYFYPKDATPGCTTEGQNFRDLYPKFRRANTVVFGVSRDSLSSHEKFKDKQSFPFELIADTDEKLCSYFDVVKEKNMYGRKFMGVERSTFLIDADGKLHREWRKVKVKGHAD